MTNGWWPHGHGGPAANAPARGFQIPISNSPDPNRRVHGAAVGGDRNAPLVFVVHGVRARKFPPCPGPLHRRLARSLLEYGRQPRRPGRPSSPLRHQPRPPGCHFLDLPPAPYEGQYVVQALFLPGLQGLGETTAGRRRKPVAARPCRGHGFRRAVRTRPDRAGGPWRIHAGGRRIRSLGRKIGTPSQIGAPGPGGGPGER